MILLIRITFADLFRLSAVGFYCHYYSDKKYIKTHEINENCANPAKGYQNNLHGFGVFSGSFHRERIEYKQYTKNAK